MTIDQLIETLQKLKRHPAAPTNNVGAYKVLAVDADSENIYEEVSGYVIDPARGTIELTTDEDGYEVNLGL